MKRGLGRGLDALISENYNTEVNISKPGEIDINKIEPNKNQPRKSFDEESIQELTDSIKQFGVIQPLIVKQVDDYYEIIAGERRFRASRKAGLKTVPAIVVDADDVMGLEISLIENLQRENLNPIEEAFTFKRLMEEFDYTQEQVGERVSKNRSTITNALRLLSLDKRVIDLILGNKITAGHGRALLAIPDETKQFDIANRIITEGLSVRAAEALASEEKELLSKPKEPKEPPKELPAKPETNYTPFETNLNRLFQTKVKIHSTGADKGRIEIAYGSAEQLDYIYTTLVNAGDKTE